MGGHISQIWAFSTNIGSFYTNSSGEGFRVSNEHQRRHLEWPKVDKKLET